MTTGKTLQNVIDRHGRLISYLLDKVAENDWHGVSDAANDLRELEVEIAIRREYESADSKGKG